MLLTLLCLDSQPLLCRTDFLAAIGMRWRSSKFGIRIVKAGPGIAHLDWAPHDPKLIAQYPYRNYFGESTKFSRGIAEGSRTPGHILRTFLSYKRYYERS
jgi:hypothetical protein